MHKIPVQWVVGDGEIANNEVNVRRYGKNESRTVKVDEAFIELAKEIKNRSL